MKTIIKFILILSGILLIIISIGQLITAGKDALTFLIPEYLIIGTIGFWIWNSGKKEKKKKEIDEHFNEIMTRELEFCENGNLLTSISTSLKLSRNEQIYAEISSDMQELRSKKINYVNNGGKIRIGSGAFSYSLGVGSIKIIPQKELTTVLTGTLYVSNKRLIINGSNDISTIDYKDILRLDLFFDGVSIYQNSKQKPTVFIYKGSLDERAKFQARMQYFIKSHTS